MIVANFGFVDSPSIGKAFTVNFLNDNLRFTLVYIHSSEIVCLKPRDLKGYRVSSY